MVLANNALTIKQIKSAIIDCQAMFHNIATVSIATVDRVLRWNELRMKQVYRVPFERNSVTIKQIKSAITDDQAMFQNIDTVSLATVDRVLRRNELRMKQVYRVPFERNSDSVK